MQTPRYEYSRSKLQERINELTTLSAPYGLTVRYAMKANPHPEILKTIHASGIHFDASSSYEALELLELGVPGENISLSSQQSAHNLEELLIAGVKYVACSQRQLEDFLSTPKRPDTVAVRINPDLGMGHNKRTNTGGPNASFGVWYEYTDKLIELTEAAGVTINRVHLHIGSGADPSVWADAMDRSLEMVDRFPTASTLDIGGGFKVHRFGDEKETDITAVMHVFADKLTTYKEKTNREIALEIEPGTFFTAHMGTLVATIDDIVDTGTDGHTFLKLNTGMNDFLRTAMYGSQHRIEVTTSKTAQKEYVVVGHNCESGDIFTTEQHDPETVATRLLNEATIGDEVRIYDTGAYCASMRALGYNSFPNAIEVLVD